MGCTKPNLKTNLRQEDIFQFGRHVFLKFFTFQKNNIDFILATQSTNSENVNKSDRKLPNIWNRKSEHIYGISDSLYDTNQVTKCKNGDPIADCFGVIARNDSAILAVADGVNWGLINQCFFKLFLKF